MVDLTLPLPGLSPIAGKEVVARFDGGRLSCDGGLLVLREIERWLGIAERLAAPTPERTVDPAAISELAPPPEVRERCRKYALAFYEMVQIPVYGERANFGQTGNADYYWQFQCKARQKQPTQSSAPAKK